jgi:hypothetical protein
MFKLNVDLNLNKISTSVYSLCDFNLWQVNMRSIHNLSNLGLIPKLNINEVEKCVSEP